MPESAQQRVAAYSPTRLALAALIALAVMALGIVAGRWQFERYEARADALRASEAAQGLPVVPWEQVVGDAESLADAEWRVVTVRGRFDAESLTPLRGRTVEREASLQYLAWLVTDSGAVLINTGWVPRDSGEVIELPTGDVELTGIVRAQEADDGKRGDGATRITAQQLPAPAKPAAPGWFMLRDPCTDEGCLGTALQPVPAPQLSLGPHLSYAFQWWLLAAAAPFITIAVLRRDARHGRERDDIETVSPGPEPATSRRRARRELSDEEIEDAL